MVFGFVSQIARSLIDDRSIDLRPERAGGDRVVDLYPGRLLDHLIDPSVTESRPRGNTGVAREEFVDEVRGGTEVGAPCAKRHLELILGIVEVCE